MNTERTTGAPTLGSPVAAVIAVPPTVPLEIVCPPWCTVTHAEHVEDLPQLEGLVIHWSDLSRRVYYSACAFIDGTPNREEGPQVYFDPPTGNPTLDNMEAFAREILAAVEEARG